MLTLNQKISILQNDLSGLSRFSKEISGGILEDSISSILFLNEKISFHDLLISEPSGLELALDVKQNAISFLSDICLNDLHVHGNINIDGSLNIGNITDLEQKIIDISNNSSSGGDLLISDTSGLEIRNKLDVSNQGTGPALKVSQFGVGDDQDVALFNAGLEGDALKIDSCGNSHFYKHVNVSGTMTSNSPWALLGQTIDGDSDGDQSGYYVSINAKGDIVAIGAPLDDNNGTNSGSTKMYQYTNGSWNQLGQTINGDSGSEQSGDSVSINAKGDIVAIGARYDDNRGTNSGSTKMYQYTDGSWNQLGQIINGNDGREESGYSVSINAKGDIVAIGTPLDYDNDSGSTKMYQYTDGLWYQLGQIIRGDSANDRSGYSVSINAKGDIVAIGARYDDNSGNDDSGTTKMYQYTNGSWNQLGQTINGDSGGVYSGWFVSINAKGDIVAIGAPFDENSGNDDSGTTKMYQYTDGSWNQFGQTINGDSAGDQSGYSVSINAKGDIVAIGAIYDVSGSTKIYQKGLRGNVTIEDDLSVGGDLFVNGGIYTDNFSVADTTGHTTIGGTLSVNESVDISNNLNVNGVTTIGGTLSVNESVDISNNLNVNGDIRVTNPSYSGFSWTMSLGIVSDSYYFFRFTLQKTNGTPDEVFEIRNNGLTDLNFTGQHRCFIKDLPFSNTEVYAGRIVCADQNTNISMSGSIKKGNKAITQNETLPYVSLSTKNKDKSCFGVISDSEDPNERVDKYGGFCTPFEKEKGDTRVYINSVGEGAIWVSNKDGPLESGDYITTCDLLGYGAKQSDDILHNYSVAKITMDCDFNPRYVPRPTILKDASGENILDPYEQIQWTDEVDSSGNVVYEYEYNIRYINSDAQIITYEEYMDNSNNSYIIAYVGCTYHCG